MKALFYERKNGEKPALDFRESLDDKMQMKMIAVIRLLEEKGTMLREPYSKKVDHEIFELRAKQGTNITRILYFFVKGGMAYLTNGFIKKSNKIPRKEL